MFLPFTFFHKMHDTVRMGGVGQKWQPNYNPEETANVKPGNHQGWIAALFQETNP